MNAEAVLIKLVNVILTIVEVFLGLRLVLKLLGANPEAGFVAWIYKTTEPLLGPFRGMFPTPTVEGVFVFEFSTLFAVLIYGLVGWLLIEFIIFMTEATKNRDAK